MCSRSCERLCFFLPHCQDACMGNISPSRRSRGPPEVAPPVIPIEIHGNTRRSSTLPPNVRREGHSPGARSGNGGSSPGSSTARAQNRNSSLPVLDTTVDVGTPLGDPIPILRQASHRSNSTKASPMYSPIEPIASGGSLEPISVRTILEWSFDPLLHDSAAQCLYIIMRL